jgi:hypothetical protein
MTEHKLTLNAWIERFDVGMYDINDRKTQIDAGWYDWFCKDSSLRNKTYKLAPIVKRIAKSKKVDPSNTYVFFKNNCPMYGSLYDNFRICDIETDDVLFTIIPSSGHTSVKGQAQLWGHENDFKEPLVEGKIKDVYNYFGV